MALPDFELGPLEMEEVHEGEPKVAPASARVRVGEDQFLLRECLPRDSYETVLYLRLDVSGSPIVGIQRIYKDPSLQDCVENPQDIKKWRWSRILSFKDNRSDLRLRISEDFMQWELESNKEYAEWDVFEGSSFDYLVGASDSDIRDRVKALLQDPDSDGSFALRWLGLDSREQSIFATRLQIGSWIEFDNILRWLAWNKLFVIVDEESFWGIWIELPDDSPDETWLNASIDLFFDFVSNTPHEETLSETVLELLRIIFYQFRPSYDHKLWRYTVVRETVTTGSFRHYVPVPVPTHHERLEARLRLREWLQDKVAPNEIPALLGEA